MPVSIFNATARLIIWAIIFLPVFYMLDMCALFMGIPLYSGIPVGYCLLLTLVSIIAFLHVVPRTVVTSMGLAGLLIVTGLSTLSQIRMAPDNPGLATSIAEQGLGLSRASAIILVAVAGFLTLSIVLAAAIAALDFVRRRSRDSIPGR